MAYSTDEMNPMPGDYQGQPRGSSATRQRRPKAAPVPMPNDDPLGLLGPVGRQKPIAVIDPATPESTGQPIVQRKAVVPTANPQPVTPVPAPGHPAAIAPGYPASGPVQQQLATWIRAAPVNTGPATGSVTGTTPINPGNDLRSTQINPTFQAQHADAAGKLVSGANLAGYTPVAGPDFTAARNALGAYRAVAGPDFGGARARLAAADQDISAMTLGDIAAIAGTDVGKTRQLYDESGQMIRGANLKGADQWEKIEAGTYDPSAEATEARSLTMQALRNAMTGTDRGRIAADTLKLMVEEMQPGFDTTIRDVGKRSAAWGRMGSGLVNRDLADVVTDRNTKIAQAERALALDAADKSLGDRINLTNLGTSTGGNFRSEDLADSTQRMNLRDEGRRERGVFMDLDDRLVQTALQKAGMITGLGDREFGVASKVRSDDENDRNFEASRQSEAARLASERAGARQRSAGMEGDFAGQEYGARVRERDTEFDQSRVRSALESDIAGQKYGARVRERDTEFDQSRARAGLDLDKANALTALDNVGFSRGQAMRDELRGERDYQSREAQQSLQNRVQSVLLGDQITNSAHQRTQDQINNWIRAAYGGGNATSDYANALFGSEPGASNGWQDIFARWAQEQAINKGKVAPVAGGHSPNNEAWAEEFINRSGAYA